MANVILSCDHVGGPNADGKYETRFSAVEGGDVWPNGRPQLDLILRDMEACPFVPGVRYTMLTLTEVV